MDQAIENCAAIVRVLPALPVRRARCGAAAADHNGCRAPEVASLRWSAPIVRTRPPSSAQFRSADPAATVLDRAVAQMTVVDVFAGAGGLSEGFRQGGFRVIAGSDNDPDAAATFVSNFPEAQFVLGDICAPGIKDRLLDAARRATVLVGGPPCQAFSQVRNHTRVIEDPRNALYREFVDVLSRSLPLAFVVENVTGIDQMGVREQITAHLELNGEYKVKSQVVDAADFGVPQTRKRLLFIGLRASLGIEPPTLGGSGAIEALSLVRFNGSLPPRYKIKVNGDTSSLRLRQALSDSDDLSVVSTADAISDLSRLPVGSRTDIRPYSDLPGPRSAYQTMMRNGAGNFVTNVQVPRINRDTELRLQSIPQGGNHRDLSEELLERYITGDLWGQSNGSGRLSRRHFYAYRRLHPKIWAWTLNTKADAAYHYRYHRALSVREFARLQSFPDRFVFTTDPRRGAIEGRHDGGPAHSRYRQVGNAVPPLLARAIARELRAILQAALDTPSRAAAAV
jgi:DNA (cytosine-5)-methyltransferase 1